MALAYSPKKDVHPDNTQETDNRTVPQDNSFNCFYIFFIPSKFISQQIFRTRYCAFICVTIVYSSFPKFQSVEKPYRHNYGLIPIGLGHGKK